MEYFYIPRKYSKRENQLDSGRGFRPLNFKLQEYQVNLYGNEPVRAEAEYNSSFVTILIYMVIKPLPL